MFILKSRQLIIASLIGATLTLQACVPLLVGSAVVGVGTVVSDRRPASMQLKDKTIAHQVEGKIKDQLVPANSRVNVVSFNQRVLLTGEVASEEDKSKATELAKNIKDVEDVVNQVIVGPVADIQTRSNDSWITSKVRTKLLTTQEVPSATMIITTSQGVVYLLGQLSSQEAEAAADTAAGVSGVRRIVKVFDLNHQSKNSNKKTETLKKTDNNTNQSSDTASETFPYNS